jgi:hypothetical protein
MTIQQHPLSTQVLVQRRREARRRRADFAKRMKFRRLFTRLVDLTNLQQPR